MYVYSLFVFIPHMIIWHLRDYCTILERKISHRVFTVRDLITEMVTGSRKRLKLSVCSLKDQALMDCSPSAILKLLDTYFREVTSHTQKSFVESLPFRKWRHCLGNKKGQALFSSENSKHTLWREFRNGCVLLGMKICDVGSLQNKGFPAV